MAEVLEMPRMSDTMEEGNIVGWLKKVGDEVEAGETIAEVETDKATMELDSPFDGVILHIAVEEGSVDIGGVIAVIGEEGEDWEAAIAELQGGSNGSSQNGSAPESTDEPAAAPVDYGSQNPEQSPGGNSDPSSGDDRVKASPLARSMAKQAGLNLSDISGTGDNGRIVKRDVEKAMEAGSQPAPSAAPQPQPAAPASAPTPPAATPQPVAAKEQAMPSVVPFTFNGGDENYQDQTVSNMRKTIARRLGESKFGAPHFYLTIEIDMENVMKLRKRLNEVSPVKLSFNDLVVKAAAALREHPVINSSWLGDKIRVNGNINIGVAVAVADGLLVPVIRHADIKSLSQISSETRALAGKAREKKLQPNEMSGNTFTISNLGMFGIEEFTAIINPPDSCIMAVGGILEKPVVKDGAIVVGQRMKVTLSCDHRTVDGASGAQFLNSFKDILENPVRLLV